MKFDRKFLKIIPSAVNFCFISVGFANLFPSNGKSNYQVKLRNVSLEDDFIEINETKYKLDIIC